MQLGDTSPPKSPQNLRQFNQVVVGHDERWHKLGKIEAFRHKERTTHGTSSRQWIGHVRTKGIELVFSRLTGSVTRAVLVMIMVATPTVLLADLRPDSQQLVALVALFAGALTFAEYNAVYPGLVEFRDAPPFNRMRFLMLFATVFCLSAIERGRMQPSTVTELIHAVGAVIGYSMDFPYSPVRLATLMLPADAPPEQVGAVRTAAGMAYLISLLSLGIFATMIGAGRWPNRERPFNVWINLPTFDPTSGGDVVARLTRDSRVNIALGFLLPFLIPAVVRTAGEGFIPMTFPSSQTLIWTMTAWAFLPASLFMRGIAMGRVADMIRERRAADRADADTRFSAA
jgi:hypothetical protein